MKQPLQNVLVLCSIDHILPGQEQEMLPSDRTVLELFGSMGGRFCMMTDRPVCELSRLTARMPACGPVIACGGAAIYDLSSREPLQAFCLNEEQAARAIRDILFRFRTAGVEIAGKNGRLYLVRANRYNYAHLEQYQVPFQLRPLEEVPAGWLQVVVRGKKEQIDEIAEHTRRKYYGVGNVYRRLDDETFAMISANASRESAVAQLFRLESAAPQKSVLLSESDEDLPLIKLVGSAVTTPAGEPGMQKGASERTLCAQAEGGIGEYLYRMVRASD